MRFGGRAGRVGGGFCVAEACAALAFGSLCARVAVERKLQWAR